MAILYKINDPLISTTELQELAMGIYTDDNIKKCVDNYICNTIFNSESEIAAFKAGMVYMTILASVKLFKFRECNITKTYKEEYDKFVMKRQGIDKIRRQN